MLDALFVGILLVIFGGIVVHAPLSVGLSALLPDHTLLIKSWKEVLLGVALVLAAILLMRHRQWSILRHKLMYAIMLYALLHLILIPVQYQGFEATVAGLFINLRFLLFFTLVYVAITLYPAAVRLFCWTFVGGALVVTVFALLQATILPHDILKYLGYSDTTIAPYLTVDQNMNYIRINSTLRGPNPLGVYATIVLAVVLAARLVGRRNGSRREETSAAILAAGSVVALWMSYSRSAALGACAAVAVVLLVVYGRQISKMVWAAFGVTLLVLTGSVVAFRDTQFVSQVILHEDPQEGNDINSNEGHVASLKEGVARMARQPLGSGIGSTGSASLHGTQPIIIENQYLFVAHETGWLGLALFLCITYYVLIETWRRRTWWLALAVCAAGIGAVVAGLFLPVWADDTVAIVWWGLAAVVIAAPRVATPHGRHQERTGKSKAKEARHG